MSKQRRHEQILAALEGGERSVEELGDQFSVSPMTIRRDLADLVATGRVQRTHGGAVLSGAGMAQFRFAGRNEHCAAEKRAIARAVAERVAPGMSLILDTGSTALEVARELRKIGQLRVLTTSLPIAAEIHDAPGVELVLLGGTLRRGLPDLTGPLAERNLSEFRVDLAILGADAATREGIFTNDLSVARVTQGMIASAEEAILVVDHSKFARRSFVKYADWESFQTVITDDGLRTEDKDWLAPAVRELVVVAP